MSLATFFGKLQEHEMELQRLNQNEETDTRKRSIALKASSSMQEEEEEDEEFDDEEDFSLFVKKFHKFVKNRRMERRHNFDNRKRSQEGLFPPFQILRMNRCHPKRCKPSWSFFLHGFSSHYFLAMIHLWGSVPLCDRVDYTYSI